MRIAPVGVENKYAVVDVTEIHIIAFLRSGH